MIPIDGNTKDPVAPIVLFPQNHTIYWISVTTGITDPISMWLSINITKCGPCVLPITQHMSLYVHSDIIFTFSASFWIQITSTVSFRAGIARCSLSHLPLEDKYFIWNVLYSNILYCVLYWYHDVKATWPHLRHWYSNEGVNHGDQAL